MITPITLNAVLNILFWLMICSLLSYLSYKYGWLKRNGEKNNYVDMQRAYWQGLYNREVKKNRCKAEIIEELKNNICGLSQVIKIQDAELKEIKPCLAKNCINYSACVDLINENYSLKEAIESKNRALENKIPNSYFITGNDLIKDSYMFGKAVVL